MIKNLYLIILFGLGSILLGIAFKTSSSCEYIEDVPAEEIVLEDTVTYQPPKEHLAKNVSHVTLTCYQPVASQCNADPMTTADGSKVNLKKLKKGSIKWCAVSRDIEYLFPMGSRVKITNEATGECFGYYEVHDRMNKRWDHRVDIMIHPEDTKIFKHNNIRIERV